MNRADSTKPLMKKVVVFKNAYFDSAVLMLVSKVVQQIAGLRNAALVMATEVNLAILREIGLVEEGKPIASPNDLIIALEGTSEKALNRALQDARDLLHKRTAGIGEDEAYRPVSLEGALKMIPNANLAVISVPGIYAAREARKALHGGLHVMLFSDHVSLEEEIALKKLAGRKGLLMMGPDCGTALINGKPLCFANAVRRGNIGIVAASGSGLQELTCLIHHAGAGVSQAIGTGGRDLTKEVGGLTMLAGVEALGSDPATEVIVALSKPPDPQVAGRVLAKLKETGKAFVVHFIGLKTLPSSERSRFAGDLEETAAMAVALSKGRPYRRRIYTSPQWNRMVNEETRSLAPGQRYLRGLYTGGTLADEAIMIFERGPFAIHSNIHTDPGRVLRDPHCSLEHTIVDLGDDPFTVGRPHPMIDPDIRAERILKEMEDPEVACLLLDAVLGYGAHEDPCGSLINVLKQARSKTRRRGGYLPIVASITGTDGDGQHREKQKKKLESIGCLVMPSNAQAARLALQIIRKAAP
jgi:succinyl-CoA synthetase alpha subunit